MRITNLDLSKYNRVFTFGCSFTNYFWPTWADIIGQEVPLYENWGKPGAGNRYISNSVVECHLTHKFQKGDLVLIMWSSISREDRYLNNHWQCLGGAGHFTKKWFDNFGMDLRGYAIRDYATILLIQNLLETLDADYDQYSMHHLLHIDYELVDHIFPVETRKYELYLNILKELHTFGTIPDEGKIVIHDNDVVNRYKTIFPKIHPPVKDLIYKKFWEKKPTINFGDNHPSPKEHLFFLDYMYPNNLLKKTTRDYVEKYETIVRNTPKEITDYIYDRHTISRL